MPKPDQVIEAYYKQELKHLILSCGAANVFRLLAEVAEEVEKECDPQKYTISFAIWSMSARKLRKLANQIDKVIKTP